MRFPTVFLLAVLFHVACFSQSCFAETGIVSWIDENGTPVFSNISLMPLNMTRPGTPGMSKPFSSEEFPAAQEDHPLNGAASADSMQAALLAEHDALEDH